MTKDDIIRMARQAGFPFNKYGLLQGDDDNEIDADAMLERFAALVADAKEAEHKEAMRWDIHSCGPTCKRYACVATREAVAAEREACAALCDEVDKESQSQWPKRLATMIRARGQQ